ncbi:hypothetical protein POKO110462_13205 [Pontibacter korlensis]|uniref:Uncharacterized protein n=1 Tax=Pontibacter korlensis TaxID=400092 RepID=A0A0E3ZHZ2_9BACT|nr:hypothetical protein [Pontibacter korlensis]AKD04314.1 hypothetical protein PKOR_15980 [Pontibacter korlensis]
MLVKEYISHVFQGQERESEHQYQAKHAESPYAGHVGDLEQELRNFYSDKVYYGNLKKSQLYAFLDFHKDKYEGEQIDFLDFVKQSPARVAHEDADEFNHLYFVPNYTERLGEWIGLREKEQKEKPFDNRITGYMSNEYIKSYFIDKFCHEKDSNGTPYFSAEEVKDFLHANFKDFNPRAKVVKRKSEALKAQAHIRRTVYQFYQKHSRSNKEKRRYCEMLRDNFHEFDESDFEETIVKGFSK